MTRLLSIASVALVAGVGFSSLSCAETISLTKPNGQQVQIDATLVLRIRAAILSADESLPHVPGAIGKTRVDWAQTNQVKEEAATVAKVVVTSLPTLTQLTLPDGDPIWLDGRKSSGPTFVPSTDKMAGVKSALIIGNKRQLLANSPEEVAAAIKAAGGDARPIPSANIEALTVTIEDWDAPPLK
ncbi:hypothetical protein SAMN02745157_4847 [Kaistia soli DSM 19436]|uniref:Uncharacterized protein n=1 Tax=Kaistia soli DSM 19436 TaxID=1122133 RepID=A0A1M5MQ03_9HYPH|nr:hypothetical protein [Kaistia soli]SHG79316.1 hypothetical protein SAMN02745157_4847 [Kaistia soli DSM 19436]